MLKGHPEVIKEDPRNKEGPSPSLPFHIPLFTMTSYSIDEYESVGEQGAYCNAILTDEACRARISSPTDSRTAVEETTVTPPPVMIPSADMIREMAEDRFLEFTERTTATVVEEVDKPINYHQEAEQPLDDDLGLPFFLNRPSSL